MIELVQARLLERSDAANFFSRNQKFYTFIDTKTASRQFNGVWAAWNHDNVARKDLVVVFTRGQGKFAA